LRAPAHGAPSVAVGAHARRAGLRPGTPTPTRCIRQSFRRARALRPPISGGRPTRCGEGSTGSG